VDYRETEEIERAAPPTEPDWLDSLDAGLVVETLARLDDAFRAPLTLFYLEDHSYREIAQILDIPIGTVMSRLSRGKIQLRRLLRDAIDSHDDKIVPLPFQERQSNG
jgi:RNA polymerase sigma-70 factor (ECF subfamily)